jgi:hypothetical protein
VALYHGRGLWPGRTFLSVDLAQNSLPWQTERRSDFHNSLLSDPIWQSYPFLAHGVAAQPWSRWNPDLLLGYPVIADPLAQPFYPVLRVLGQLLGPARGLALGLWLHVLWAGVAMLGYLRTLGCRPRAALLGALAYALGGGLVTWLEYTHLAGTLAWLPAVLWGFELALQRRSLRYTALSALAAAVAILNGQVQFVAIFFVFLGLYALGRTVQEQRRGVEGRWVLWPLAQFMLVALLGGASAAVLLVPFVEYLGLSHRSQSAGLGDALPLRQLLTLWTPDYYGNPTVTGEYWGANNYNEDTVYAGIVTLYLAVLALLTVRRGLVLTQGLILAALVYIIVGGPGVRALGALPLVSYLALPRAGFSLVLPVAILAACWLDAPPASLRRTLPVALLTAGLFAGLIGGSVALDVGGVQAHLATVRPGIAAAFAQTAAAALLVVLRARWPRYRAQAEWALVALLLADLALWGSRYNSVGPVAELYPATPGIRQLQTLAGGARVGVVQAAKSPLFGLNVLPLFGLAEVGGYSSLAPARLVALIDAADPKEHAGGVGNWWKHNRNIVFLSNPSTRLADLLGLEYLVSAVALPIANESTELEAPECAAGSGEIAPGQAVTGAFGVADTAINRLDLSFRVYRPGSAQGVLWVRMWRLAGDAPVLMFEEQVEAAALVDRRPVTFYFAPELEAPGKRYRVEVAAAGPAPSGVGLCLTAEGEPAWGVYGLDWQEVAAGEFFVYRRLGAMARAYVAYAAEPVDGAAAITRLLDESFDLRNVVVTAAPLDLPHTPDLPATAATVTAYGANRVVVQAEARQPGVLVVGDLYHPGWQATVDGAPAPVVPANWLLRGVPLPAGTHEVVLRFWPRSLTAGMWISGLAWALCIALIVARWPRRSD